MLLSHGQMYWVSLHFVSRKRLTCFINVYCVWVGSLSWVINYSLFFVTTFAGTALVSCHSFFICSFFQVVQCRNSSLTFPHSKNNCFSTFICSFVIYVWRPTSIVLLKINRVTRSLRVLNVNLKSYVGINMFLWFSSKYLRIHLHTCWVRTADRISFLQQRIKPRNLKFTANYTWQSQQWASHMISLFRPTATHKDSINDSPV